MIRCTLCEGELRMKPDGNGAFCTGCGMGYSMELLRRMIAEDRQQAAPTQPSQPSQPS